MNVDDVLSTHFEGVAPLNRPIMVVALRGWFDIAEVATTAINELLADRVAPIVASIDPDPFFDFTQERPFVELDDDEITAHPLAGQRVPFARFPGSPHDLVVLVGVEPHLRYATFADSVLQVAQAVEVRGGGDGRRRCRHDPAHPCATRGRQHDQRRSAAAPSVCRLRVIRASPAWSACCRNDSIEPAFRPCRCASACRTTSAMPSIRNRRSRCCNTFTMCSACRCTLLASAADAARRRVLHDEAVAEDEQATAYVAMLEREYDQKAEEAIPSGDDLAADFERFLREQRDDEG